MTKEVWKPINKNYKVSNYGNVLSLDKKILVKRNDYRTGAKCKYYLEIKGKKLKPIKKLQTGYLAVGINSKQELIHRLVAKAFIPNPENKPMINHKDGNKENNHISNLEWCTLSENTKHAYRVLGVTPNQLGVFGEKHNTSKPVIQKTLDGKFIKRWGCGMDAVRDGGFMSSQISRCCRGEIKHHKGYKWSYEKN